METLSMIQRPRRNRKSANIRAMVQETRLFPSHLIAAYFIQEGKNIKENNLKLSGVENFSIDLFLKEIESLLILGIPAIALFPIIPKGLKDARGIEALNPQGIMPKAISAIKKAFPQLVVISDVALDPYTNHGHDGVIGKNQEIANDETVHILAQMARIHADAGVDIVAPSDMMDGRVKAIRNCLDNAGHTNTSIMSYAVKYASSFYAPYRETLSSTVTFGDKKSYHMNPANFREALREIRLDEEEGADFLMIKPSLAYMDIIYKVRQETSLPLVAFQVSGEYAMLKAAAEKDLLNFDSAFYECCLGLKRAGSDLIITYGAKHLAKLLLRN